PQGALADGYDVTLSRAARRALGWTCRTRGGGRLRLAFELCGLKNGVAEQGRDRDAIRDQHARSGDRRQPDLDVARLLQIADNVAAGAMARDRHIGRTADDGGAAIAFLGLYALHSFERQREIEALPAVENRQLGVTSLTADDLTGARHGDHQRGHGIEDAGTGA